MASSDAGLVVMGSAAITASTAVSGSSSVAAAVGSVAVACAKRLRTPLAIVTANTRLLRSPAGTRVMMMMMMMLPLLYLMVKNGGMLMEVYRRRFC